MRFKNFTEAIELYRNAKIIGIIALYQLEQDKIKKEELLQKFKTDLEDANYSIEQYSFRKFLKSVSDQ
ncbi:MAG: hypothetical protein KatS3mg129_0439 [Leptospiraceae bacterium]|nr:MAG: hypothetical protein KatS3mg129_0439 [Leptospiraceae bacterium]